MGAPDSTHEIDDGHHHDARCDDLHTQGYRAAAPRPYDPCAGSDDDEEERAPGFREKAAPFMSGVQKVGRRRWVQHAPLCCRSRSLRVC